MEPIRKDKPSPAVFFLMTATFFAAYFGLKYGVLGPATPWYVQALLIFVALGLVLAVHRHFTRK